MDVRDLTSEIIGAAVEVHKTLGPGLLESAYQRCLIYELRVRKLNVQSEVQLPLLYKNNSLDAGFRLDLIVDELVIVELKAVSSLKPVHKAQVITYLKLSGYKLGLLINFNEARLIDGVKRVILSR